MTGGTAQTTQFATDKLLQVWCLTPGMTQSELLAMAWESVSPASGCEHRAKQDVAAEKLAINRADEGRFELAQINPFGDYLFMWPWSDRNR